MRVDCAKRRIAAAADRIYQTLTDRDAVQNWLPPEGAQGVIEKFDPCPGGLFRMTLEFGTPGGSGGRKAPRTTEVVDGEFLELVPDRFVRQRFRFESDDPSFAGEMVMTWTLTPSSEGTDVTIAVENVPMGITPQDHEAGMTSSLTHLANGLNSMRRKLAPHVSGTSGAGK